MHHVQYHSEVNKETTEYQYVSENQASWKQIEHYYGATPRRTCS